MRIIDLDRLPTAPVSAFASAGFSVTPIATGAHVVLAHLDAGGVIGRHDAVVDQLLVVLTGDAWVSGPDGAEALVGPGQGAVWAAGESHETRTDSGMTGLVIEAVGLSADNA